MTHKQSREIIFLGTRLYKIIFTGLHNYSPGGQLKGRHTVANKQENYIMMINAVTDVLVQ